MLVHVSGVLWTVSESILQNHCGNRYHLWTKMVRVLCKVIDVVRVQYLRRLNKKRTRMIWDIFSRSNLFSVSICAKRSSISAFFLALVFRCVAALGHLLSMLHFISRNCEEKEQFDVNTITEHYLKAAERNSPFAYDAPDISECSVPYTLYFVLALLFYRDPWFLVMERKNREWIDKKNKWQVSVEDARGIDSNS